MIVTLELSVGDWQQIMTLVLRYTGGGQGTWQVVDPSWINLIAHQKSGPFECKRAGGQPSVYCYDGDGDDPAFVLVDGPAGEWEKKPNQGLMVIENPRNSYGLEVDAYWRMLRSPF